MPLKLLPTPPGSIKKHGRTHNGSMTSAIIVGVINGDFPCQKSTSRFTRLLPVVPY